MSESLAVIAGLFLPALAVVALAGVLIAGATALVIGAWSWPAFVVGAFAMLAVLLVAFAAAGAK